MEKLRFIASVTDERIGDIQHIAHNLTELGCTIENVLPFSGIITGITDAPLVKLQDLKIDGIKTVEPDRDVELF